MLVQGNINNPAQTMAMILKPLIILNSFSEERFRILRKTTESDCTLIQHFPFSTFSKVRVIYLMTNA